MGSLLASLALAAPCPGPSAALDTATTAVVEGRIDDARAALADAESTFGCGLATPTQLGRFWATEGALLLLDGQEDLAAVAFASARRVDPAVSAAAFGPAAESALGGARGPGGEGHLALRPHVDSALLDGALADLPATVPAGLHLVQLDHEGAVVWSGVVNVLDGRLLKLDTGMSRPAVPSLPDPPPLEGRRGPGLLVPGFVGLALAAGSFAMWGVANGALADAPDVASLRRAQDRKMGFGAATVAFGAMGGLCIAGELAF